ncbi:MAG: hypothetical protein LBT19_01985 [Candidatus Nomurabacteria bacterium]|jgi:UDP-N-acetylmuramoyl-L-alanyl-D-glutamate--2,6-diaminopimelate ligase|nr:hypothetical protein [Candidatus Nomurabacteria bacterium]
MKDALKKPSLKSKVQKAKAKLASAYYGNPSKDMKIIAVTGMGGKGVVAHFIQEILRATDPRVGLVDTGGEKALTAGGLQRKLSKSWREGANYVVVMAAADAVKNQAFAGVPVHMVVMTDPLGNEVSQDTADEYAVVKTELFTPEPEYSVLNYDDPYFEFVAKYPTKKGSVAYGKDREADTWVSRSKAYKKGTEATLTQGNDSFDVATYVTGNEAAAYMAAAATAAALLGVEEDAIVDGIASFEPNFKP